MSKEISQNFPYAVLGRPKLVLYVGADRRVIGQCRYLPERIAYREEDAVNLRVFVYSGKHQFPENWAARRCHTEEHQRVRHILIAHVDDPAPYPGAHALLCAVQDRVHHARGLGRGLHAVEPLPRVAQAVRCLL